MSRALFLSVQLIGNNAALRERARAAGVEVEDSPEGALLRDPSGNALLFRPA